MKKINILGINVSDLNKEKVLEMIGEYLDGQKQHYIVTPNPEIILTAQHDEELFYILNNADISVVDGFGLKLAALSSGTDIERITGADLILDILRMAEAKKKKVLIFNWRDGLSGGQEIENKIKIIFPDLYLKIINIDREGKEIDHIKASGSGHDILISTAGAPFQEKIVYSSLKNFNSVKLGIGIGGALDFLTGNAKRAPKIFRFFGIEWFWRMIQQHNVSGKKIFFFKRIRRVFRAVIIFPVKFIIWKYILPFFYRHNVACLLFKKENGKIKVLIVERLERHDHWQLPQGGTDGEDIMTAGARELREETNCADFKPIAGYKNLFKYKFGKTYPGKFGYDSGRSWGYKGQKQGLFVAEFLGDDSCIRMNHWEHKSWKWVYVDQLLKTIHPIRREAVEIYLRKFKECV